MTPQIKKLIQEHHLGSILLTAKNLKCEHIYQFRGAFMILTTRSCRAVY